MADVRPDRRSFLGGMLAGVAGLFGVRAASDGKVPGTPSADELRRLVDHDRFVAEWDGFDPFTDNGVTVLHRGGVLNIPENATITTLYVTGGTVQWEPAIKTSTFTENR